MASQTGSSYVRPDSGGRLPTQSKDAMGTDLHGHCCTKHLQNGKTLVIAFFTYGQRGKPSGPVKIKIYITFVTLYNLCNLYNLHHTKKIRLCLPMQGMQTCSTVQGTKPLSGQGTCRRACTPGESWALQESHRNCPLPPLPSSLPSSPGCSVLCPLPTQPTRPHLLIPLSCPFSHREWSPSLQGETRPPILGG